MNKFYLTILSFILALVLIIPTSCKAFDEFKKPTVIIGGEAIEVEIANTPETRKMGLMNVKYLPPKKGMLFIFDEVTKPVFWMKDCFISLDIIFIKDNKIVSIYTSVPPCKVYPCELYPSMDYADRVLEVNGGFVKTHDVKINDEVQYKGFRL